MTKVLTTKMSSRGQIVVPEELRNEFGWGVGTSFTVEVYQGSVIMQPLRPTPQTQMAKRFDALLAQSRAEAKAAGLQIEDISNVISEYRAERRAAWTVV